MSTVALARGDTSHRYTISGDLGRSVSPAGWVPVVLNEEEYLEDPLRILIHPSFPQEDGQGIYTYSSNPDITRNFALGPVRKVDATPVRTLSSNILVQQPQVDEDIVITEIWTGEDKLSTLASMARTFLEFWQKIPEIGENLIWQPRDLSEESFGVQIIRVDLGGSGDWEYQEVRENLSTREGAYLARTLTIQYKLIREVRPPKGVISLAGA